MKKISYVIVAICILGCKPKKEIFTQSQEDITKLDLHILDCKLRYDYLNRKYFEFDIQFINNSDKLINIISPNTNEKNIPNPYQTLYHPKRIYNDDDFEIIETKAKEPLDFISLLPKGKINFKYIEEYYNPNENKAANSDYFIQIVYNTLDYKGIAETEGFEQKMQFIYKRNAIEIIKLMKDISYLEVLSNKFKIELSE